MACITTPETRAAMQVDRDRGLSGSQIAKRHGGSKSNVYRVTVGAGLCAVTNQIARAMQDDRDGGMTIVDIAEKHGWAPGTVWKHTTGPSQRWKPDLPRYRRMIAANAVACGNRDEIARRFGLKNRQSLSVMVAVGRRLLRDGEPHPVRTGR